MKDIYMVTKSSNVYYIYDQSGPRVAQRVRSKRPVRAEQHIITEAAPNELKLGRDA